MSSNLKDVAVLAGVSPSTVSNYLNRPHVVSEPTRRRIAAAVAELGFVRNESARQLRSGRSRTFALLLVDAWAPYFNELARGVEDAAVDSGWTVLFSNSARDAGREARHLAVFEAHRVQGVLVVPQGDVGERLAAMQGRGISCVTIGRPRVAADIPSVSLDDVRGGRLAAEHLLAVGATDLVFVGNPGRVSHAAARLEGFAGALASSPVAPTLTQIETAGLSMRDGLEAARRLLEVPVSERPHGMFAANDLVALGAVQVFHRGGLQVPRDMSVVGYDDIEYAQQAAVPLTTVRQPAYDMGYAGADLLIAHMEGRAADREQHLVFEPELVVRDSTAVLPAG